jgi:hypothetical protein
MGSAKRPDQVAGGDVVMVIKAWRMLAKDGGQGDGARGHRWDSCNARRLATSANLRQTGMKIA